MGVVILDLADLVSSSIESYISSVNFLSLVDHLLQVKFSF